MVSNYEELSMNINQHEALGPLVLPGLGVAKDRTLSLSLFERKIQAKKVVGKVLGIH